MGWPSARISGWSARAILHSSAHTQRVRFLARKRWGIKVEGRVQARRLKCLYLGQSDDSLTDFQPMMGRMGVLPKRKSLSLDFFVQSYCRILCACVQSGKHLHKCGLTSQLHTSFGPMSPHRFAPSLTTCAGNPNVSEV